MEKLTHPWRRRLVLGRHTHWIKEVLQETPCGGESCLTFVACPSRCRKVMYTTKLVVPPQDKGYNQLQQTLIGRVMQGEYSCNFEEIGEKYEPTKVVVEEGGS